MSDQKWKLFDMEKLEEVNEENRKWTEELLQQNRMIIKQNQKIIDHNVAMLEKLGSPGHIVSIDPATDTTEQDEDT